LTLENDFTGRIAINTRYPVKKGCFARTIGSDQTKDLSLIDVETNVINRYQPAKVFSG
jgi:hypothetical protein